MYRGGVQNQAEKIQKMSSGRYRYKNLLFQRIRHKHQISVVKCHDNFATIYDKLRTHLRQLAELPRGVSVRGMSA